MLRSFRLAMRILRALWRIGLVSFKPSVPVAFLRAWWRCGNSYACLAEFAAYRFPSRHAVVDEQGSLTFRDLHARAEGFASFLRQQHALRPSHRVALLSRNHRDMVVALVALTRLGVDVLLLGTDSPGPALQRIPLPTLASAGFARPRIRRVAGRLSGTVPDPGKQPCPYAPPSSPESEDRANPGLDLGFHGRRQEHRQAPHPGKPTSRSCRTVASATLADARACRRGDSPVPRVRPGVDSPGTDVWGTALRGPAA